MKVISSKIDSNLIFFYILKLTLKEDYYLMFFNCLYIFVSNYLGKKTEKEPALFAKKTCKHHHYEYETWKSFRAPKYLFLTKAMMIDCLAFLRH